MRLFQLGKVRILLKTHEDQSCKEKVRYGREQTALRAVDETETRQRTGSV